MEVKIVKNILDANERIASENRKLFDRKGVFVINVMGSPGSGKTSLLEKTIAALKDDVRICVVEGDIQSSIDAEKIAALGVKAIQINTGGACHLDGNMVKEAISDVDLDNVDLLIVENVGNLVCPAEFKMGENFKVMLLSVTEGDDKPQKYPLMFHESKALLVNKIDLLPHVNADPAKIKKDCLNINPKLNIFEISCTKNEGIDQWVKWLKKEMKNG